eukprot:4222939-Prymnesium_polylepis.1
MIATVSPSSLDVEESRSTLRYAERAKKIVNVPTVNMDARDALVESLRGEIAELKQQVRALVTPRM